ncbi:MAG: aminoglycoside phosphotransferase family protein [Deltaproteobacteria bacterium]|nr:aminoglycoside phosphotransferase family protein [Deltaproteobacteria bacterium]
MLSLPELSRQLGDDLFVLVNTVNVPLVEITPLSGVGYPGYQPSAFRLRFADGRILKGRQFGGITRAVKVEYVLQHVHHQGFPKSVARSGRALLTEWVEGHPLAPAGGNPELLRQCGALQGFMHNVAVPDDSPYQPRDTIQDWHARLEHNLAELLKARVLEKSEARRAFELAVRYAPSSYAVGFVHRDFCGENLIQRPSGDICIIDNETLALDAYDYDLGRTWYRWPMNPAQRQAYLDGYQCYRNAKDFLMHFPYWGIAAVVIAAGFRLQKQTGAASVPLQRLRALLHTLEQGYSPASAVFHL